MRKLRPVLVLVLGATLPGTAAAGAERGEDIAELVIENVSVLPMDREEVLRERRVFLGDGVVLAIEPADSTRPARRVVDGRGGYLLPGLADMQCTFARTRRSPSCSSWPAASRRFGTWTQATAGSTTWP